MANHCWDYLGRATSVQCLFSALELAESSRMVTWQTLLASLTSLLTLDIRRDKPGVLILVTAMVAQFL